MMSISHWKQKLRQIKEHTLERSIQHTERVVESIESMIQQVEKKRPTAPTESTLQGRGGTEGRGHGDDTCTQGGETVVVSRDDSLQQGVQILMTPDPYAQIMADMETEWKELQAQSRKLWEKKCQERQQQYRNYLEKLEEMAEFLSWLEPDADRLQRVRHLHRKIQEDSERLHHFHQNLIHQVKYLPLISFDGSKEGVHIQAESREILRSTEIREQQVPEGVCVLQQPRDNQDAKPRIQEVHSEPSKALDMTESAASVSLVCGDCVETLVESEQDQKSDVPEQTPTEGSQTAVEVSTESKSSRWQQWIRLGTAALAQHPQLQEDAFASRFVGVILSVRTTSSVCSMANEMQQAHKRLSREQWDMLISLAALRLAQLDLHYSSCSRFSVVHNGLRQIWSAVGSEELRECSRKQDGSVLTTTENQTQPANTPEFSAKSLGWETKTPPVDIGFEAKRLKKHLPDHLKVYVDQLEQELFDDSLNPWPYLNTEERALLLESLGTRARWVQDHLPSHEKEQPRVCSWFGIIRSHRQHWCPESWLNTLDRKFTPEHGWASYLRELQEKLQNMQEVQRRELEDELNVLEDQRRQRLVMLESLARLRGLADVLDPTLSIEHPDAKKFLQILEHLLENELVASSHGELLQIVAPFSSWLAEGKLFRSLRKHLRKFQDVDAITITASSETMPLPFDESDWQEESAEQKVSEDAMSQLLQKIIPQTRGKRALIVGGDEREEKRQRLEKRLQLQSLTWIPSEEGRIRKIDQAVGRMESGQIELLILLLSFCGHSKVNRLIQAAKRHEVLCIPVDHGHGEVRVIRRIAYYLGYLESSDVLLRS